MQVQKLRAGAADHGLVPAGQYFARLARGLEEANSREAALRRKLDNEDRQLEARYRRASAARSSASEGYAAAL